MFSWSYADYDEYNQLLKEIEMQRMGKNKHFIFRGIETGAWKDLGNFLLYRNCPPIRKVVSFFTQESRAYNFGEMASIFVGLEIANGRVEAVRFVNELPNYQYETFDSVYYFEKSIAKGEADIRLKSLLL